MSSAATHLVYRLTSEAPVRAVPWSLDRGPGTSPGLMVPRQGTQDDKVVCHG